MIVVWIPPMNDLITELEVVFLWSTMTSPLEGEPKTLEISGDRWHICNETISLWMWHNVADQNPNNPKYQCWNVCGFFLNGKSHFVAIRLPPSPDQGYMKKNIFQTCFDHCHSDHDWCESSRTEPSHSVHGCTEMVLGPNLVPLMNILKMATQLNP